MKRGLAFFVFSILVFSASVFSQKLTVTQTDSRLQKSTVVYAGTRAFSDGRGVWLEWNTSSETKIIGFYLYRQVGKDKVLVNSSIIGGSYLRAGEEQTSGDTYSYFDPSGNSYDTYFIESLNTDGKRQVSQPVFPQYINDLTTVAGKSSLTLTDNLAKANPVVLENKPVLSKELKNTISSNSSLPDLDTQRWVASQPGVKIGVKQEGFFRVTRAQLQAAGFAVNELVTLWKLFLNGVEQSIIVDGNGDYIEFYGKGLDTQETDTQVYYLLADTRVGTTNGKRIQTITLPSNGNQNSVNYIYNTKYKYRSLYISDILNGDAENFFGSQIISTTTGVSVNFEVPDIDCDSINGPFFPCNSKRLSIAVGVQGLTLTSHSIRVELNGVDIGFIFGDGHSLMQQNFKISAAVAGRVVQGTNVLKFSTTGTSGDVSLLESISVNYKRKYQAINNQLSFTTADFKKSKLGGFTSPNVRVFDLNVPDALTRIDLPVVQEGTTYKIDLPSNQMRAMFAVEDSAVATPAWVIPNTPSTLSTPAHNANLIIVTHPDFAAEAETWANYRRGQGLSVEVLKIDDIFDEYNYGAQDTLAMRNFFEYAKNNWQTPPQYILLLGDASYDYRNYEGRGNFNFVPTRLVNTVYMETGSDETLADFNDDGLAEIAIGRIPARTPENVSQLLNKTIAFEQSVSQWTNRGALFAFDQSIGYDFEALSHRVATQLPANMPQTFIGRTYSTVVADQQANQLELLNAISTGKYLVNYSGHGSTGGWTSSPMFFNSNNTQVDQPTTPPTIPIVRNSDNFSTFMMLTCLNGYFIRNDGDSLSERLLKARWYEESNPPTNPPTYQVHEVGAAATWTSSGKTTPDVQEVMATRFLSQVTAGSMTRFGDLVMDAKTTLIGGRDVRLSWVLLGDPTLKLR
ncbi:hypothetical protein BH10ACI1_BH10ACI1_07340 [soil metagenome]